MVELLSSESLAKRLGKNIANQRKSLGMTQSVLAESISLEPESISRFERGATLPSLATLLQVSAVLKTTVADLLSEYPGNAYPEEKRIAKLLSELEAVEKREIVSIIERFCSLLRSKNKTNAID